MADDTSQPEQPNRFRAVTERWRWSRRAPSKSEVWAQQHLQPGPLVPHLAQLHGLAVMQGMEGSMLAVFEHSLKQIAVYTRDNPYDRRWQ